LGTRLRPLTDDRPKALVQVNGRPLLEHILLKLRRQGFDRVVVNVHHFGEQVIEFLRSNDHFGMDIRVSDERSLLLNTGGGLKGALPLLLSDQPVLIHNVDIASDLDLATLYETAERGSIDFGALLVTQQRPTSRFLLFNDMGLLRGWMNVGNTGTSVGKAMGDEPIDRLNRLPFTGIHVVLPSLFPALCDYHDSVFSIIDFYLSMCTSHALVSYPMQTSCRWVDCGRVESLSKAADILVNPRY